MHLTSASRPAGLYLGAGCFDRCLEDAYTMGLLRVRVTGRVKEPVSILGTLSDTEMARVQQMIISISSSFPWFVSSSRFSKG